MKSFAQVSWTFLVSFLHSDQQLHLQNWPGRLLKSLPLPAFAGEKNVVLETSCICIWQSDPVAACLGWRGREGMEGLWSYPLLGGTQGKQIAGATVTHQSTGPCRLVQVCCGRRLPSLQTDFWDAQVKQQLPVSVASSMQHGCLLA